MKKTLGLLVLVLIAAGALLLLRNPSPSPLASLSCPDCNVLLIGVDTLRADHVHSFGYARETTPTLDRLASQAISFTNAISASSWTVPSFMSVMTGVFPSVHKVVNKYVSFDPKDTDKQIISNLKKLSPGTETLAEVMRSNGFATGGFTGDAGVGAGFGYSQGFDTYTDEKTFGGFGNSQTHALSWLDSLPKGKKFFMFFHGYDLHGQFSLPKKEQVFVPSDYRGPYTGSPVEEAKLREGQLSAPLTFTAADQAFWTGLYDSKIKEADAQVGNFLSELQKRGLLDHTIVVVTADHGEEFFEHGGIDHGHSLYDELVHVPLIVVVPGVTGGKKVVAQVSTMDIAPMILKLSGATIDQSFAAQTKDVPDLVAYLASPEKRGADVFIETDYRDFTHKRAIRTADGWKYIVTLESGAAELYDLNSDPNEKNNLVETKPEKASLLRDRLDAHLRTLGSSVAAKAPTGCLPVYKGECE